MNQSGNLKGSFFLILITYLAFISLGLPDGLLGIAWPFMSEKFHVPLDALGLLLIGFTSGYLLTSTTSGKILSIISLGLILSISCFMTGISLLAYAFSNYWHLTVVASFFLGSGGGAIDSSINTFAASRFSASVVNWLHAFYGVGATAGPLLVTWMLAHDFQWFHGYITIAIIQISLSVLFLFTLRYWRMSSHEEESQTSAEYRHTLKLPVVWVGIIIFFLYTGLEQGFGQWLFTILTKSRGVGEEEAGLWTSAYWGSLTVGRIVFGIILTRIPTNKVLMGAMVGIVAGTSIVALNQSNLLNLLGIIIIGISNAPIFPSLISITPNLVGKEHAASAIGLQISAAMAGAALLPGFAGLLTDTFGIEVITIVFVFASVLLLGLYFFTYNFKKKRITK